MTTRRSVALIMPALNEEESVATTLDSVFASTRLPDEIVVADGMSRDRTRELVLGYTNRGVPIRIVDNPMVFAGAGRNVAVQNSTSDVLLLVDFGNTLDQHWIEEMARPFEEDETIEVTGGVFLPIIRSDFEFCVAAIHYPMSFRMAKLTPEQRLKVIPDKPDPGGLSIGISRDLWQRMDGMPDWLRASEDKMFGRKFMSRGAKTRFVPTAVMYHHMRSTPRQLFNQMFVYWRGTGRTAHFRLYAIKLFGFYSLLLAMLAGSMYWPSTFWVAVVMLAGYIWHAGARKILQVEARPKSRYFFLSPLVVFPRDIGTMLGQLAGSLEWIFVPHFRQRLRTYMATSGSLTKNNV